jgi:hypothetical protein
MIDEIEKKISDTLSSLFSHKGVDALPEGKVKSAAQYLWIFSQIHNWEIPTVAPCDNNKNACFQWGCKIISYILYHELENNVTIEIDKEGLIKEFLFPEEMSTLDNFLLN